MRDLDDVVGWLKDVGFRGPDGNQYGSQLWRRERRQLAGPLGAIFRPFRGGPRKDRLKKLATCVQLASRPGVRAAIAGADGAEVASRLCDNLNLLLTSAVLAYAAWLQSKHGRVPPNVTDQVWPGVMRAVGAKPNQQDAEPRWSDSRLLGLSAADWLKHFFAVLGNYPQPPVAQALDWSLHWLKAQAHAIDAVCLPVAYVDHFAEGRIAFLHFDAVQGDARTVYEDPRNWWRPLEGDLVATVVKAAERASCAVRWRLEAESNAVLGGDSLGGAAHVLARCVGAHDRLDDQCVIIARVVDGCHLEPVAHVEEKLAAARGAGLRRAVVAEDPNLGQAEVIQGVAVIRCRTVDEAANVVAPLKAPLRDYLEAVVKAPDERLPDWLRDRRLTSVYLTPDVTPQSPTEPRKREVPRERWAGGTDRCIVVGPPGQGKTSLTQMDARACAEQAQSSLGKVAFERLTIPLCVPLKAAFKEEVSDDALEGWLTGKRPQGLGVAKALAQELVRRLTGCDAGGVRLWLDGLDELEPKRREDTLEWLAQVGCPVVVTSRPEGLSCNLPNTFRRYDLADLSTEQSEMLVTSWFGEKHDAARQALAAATANGLAVNAFLLSLVCAVGDDEGRLHPTISRTELYRAFIARLLRGQYGAQNALLGAKWLALLPELAWRMVTNNPTSPAVNADELVHVLRSELGLEAVEDTWQQLFIERVLVEVGEEQYAFGHRSIADYLAARHLAKGCNDLFVEIERFLWHQEDGAERWEPAAAEMIVFLGGCLRDATPLVEHLVTRNRDKPDLGHTMLVLAGRVATEAGLEAQQETIATALREHLGDHFQLVRLPDALRHRPGRQMLREALLDVNRPDVREEAARTLGLVGMDQADLDALAAALLFDPSPAVRGAAARSLGQSGDDTARALLACVALGTPAGLAIEDDAYVWGEAAYWLQGRPALLCSLMLTGDWSIPGLVLKGIGKLTGGTYQGDSCELLLKYQGPLRSLLRGRRDFRPEMLVWFDCLVAAAKEQSLQALPVEETIDLNHHRYLRKPLGILLDHLLRTFPMRTSELDRVLRQPLGLTAAPRPLQPPAEDRAPEVARFWWEAGLGDVREVLCFWWEAGLGDVADERLLRLFDYDRPPQRDSIVECCLYKPRADALKQRTRGGAAPWPDYAPILDVTPSAWPLLSDLSRQPLAWQPRWLRRMGSRSWQFDPEQVADLALRHPDPLVRAEAVLRAYVSSHSDRDHIVGLSLDDPHWWVNRIADFLRKHAEPPIGGSGSERIAEIKQIQEPAALAAIACDAEASVAERWHAARQLAPLIQSGLFVAPGQLGPAR